MEVQEQRTTEGRHRKLRYHRARARGGERGTEARGGEERGELPLRGQ